MYWTTSDMPLLDSHANLLCFLPDISSLLTLFSINYEKRLIFELFLQLFHLGMLCIKVPDLCISRGESLLALPAYEVFECTPLH